MRHRKQAVKLGRSSSHRKALLSALVCGLIERKRIVTTLPKARLARRAAEKMVTIGKQQTLAARRRALSALGREGAVCELFDRIAPQCHERPGGWTRIIKTGSRRGDGAEMALLEWTVSIAPKPGKTTDKPAAAEKA